MKISYCSDLHLEFLNFPDFTKEEGGDILLLAGDIVVASMLHETRTDQSAKKVKKYLSTKFKKGLIDKYDTVLMVMGNHEHYRSSLPNTQQLLNDGFDQLGLSKIRVLENDFWKNDNIVIAGATLWTDFDGGNPLTMMACEGGMNDFSQIGKVNPSNATYFDKGNLLITAQDLLTIHRDSVQFLYDLLHQDFIHRKDVIFMTHHGPTFQSLNPAHCGNGLDGAYCSNLAWLMEQYPNIKYWIHGHTHAHHDYHVFNTNVLANQRGYNVGFVREDCFTRWKGLKHINI